MRVQDSLLAVYGREAGRHCSTWTTQMAKIYNLFISHSWSYGDDYDRLCDLLDAAPDFTYRNYSIPQDDPLHTSANTRALYEAIRQQMTFCHVVVVLAGKYATYSEWIDREITCATEDLDKPILAVRPLGSQQVSSVVLEVADELVSWNTDSIVSGIRSVAL